MASDGDLLDADGEDAAPAQRVLQVYNVSLVTALDGNVTSKRFRSKMVDNLEVMREILGRDDFDFSDTDALPDSAIEAMDLSNAATFFKAGENYEGPAKKKRSPKAMMRRAAKSVILSARMEADARAADQRRLELRESIEQSLARERVTALAQSKMRGEDNVRYSVTRLNYLDLAQKLFDAGRYQKGYELLSSARALGEVAKIEAEAIARRRAKADAAQNPMDADAALQDLRAQAKVNPGPRAADDFEIARSHPLEQTFRDLTTRRDDLRTRAAAMLKLYTKVNGADDPSTARLDTLLTNAGELPAIQPETLDLTPLAQGASDDAIVNFDAGVVILQARHDEWDAAMDGYDTALDELDGLGLDDAKAALKDTLKALKKLVHTSGGVAERDDGNVDGIGTIALRGKAEDIPQELVRPVVAQIEALEYMAEGSSMSAEQYGLMEEFRDAALAQITALSDGKRDYAAIADAIEKIEALLEHDAFAYWASEKSKLGTDLEQLRKDLLIDSASGAWVKAEALLAEAGQSKTGAKLYRTQFGELLAHYTAVKEEQTKSYQDALKALVALPVDASGAQAWASKLKDLKTTFNDHGAVHAAFEAIWATATPGDPTTYDNTRSAIDDLKQRLETEQRSMGIALSQAQAYLVQNADTTLRDWLADPNTVPGMARPVAAAIADMTDAKREEEQTKALTKSISDLDGEMRKYIRLNAGGFTLDPRVNFAGKKNRGKVRKDMRQAFENHTLILDALKMRAEHATTVEQLSDIEREMRATQEKIERFAEDNRPETEEEASAEVLERAAKVVEHACADLSRFEMDVRALIARVLGRERGKADTALAADGADATARAVVTILSNKDAALRAFGDRVIDVSDTATLAPCADALRGAETDDAKMAIRERALALIRRKRLFLEEARHGLLYRANPVDFGAPATALIGALSSAEAKLLTLVKRG